MIRLPRSDSRFASRSIYVWLMVGVFFTALLLLGLWIYRDYGISWDESTQVELGIRTYRYVMKHDSALLAWRDRSYGPFFEILLVIFQSRGASREMYFSRHLLTFLSFFAGCLGFFALAKLLYKRTWLALVGCLFLVLSPRIFADAFYNTKDIPFLVLYIFALLGFVLLLDYPSLWTALGLGLISAALLAVRLPGLVIPALVIGGLLFEMLVCRLRWREGLFLGAVYLLVTFVGLVAFWPALWPSPLTELLNAFQMMKNFPHLTGMLYLGNVISSENVPWHYIPVWIAVTTPLFYLALLGIGVVVLISGWVRAPRRLLTRAGRNDFIMLSAWLAPILAVILLKSTLYDGWRQLFFIYPPLILTALRGLPGFVDWMQGRLPRFGKIVLVSLLLLGVLPVAQWMIVHHPFQNIYFNRLAGVDMQEIQHRFMLDYWGLSYRQGLEYILTHDPDARIPVFVETAAGQRNAAIFPTAQEKRLDFVNDFRQAKYFIGNFYNNPDGYPLKNEVYAVRVGNAKILAVYQLSEEEKQ